MSATDELRRMLDERGVEWTKPKSATEFMQTTFLCNGWGIEVLERNIGLCVTATNIFDTPEQAISATLGGEERTCRIEIDEFGCYPCSACGVDIPSMFVGRIDYCPYCGARVTPKNSETTPKVVSE